MDSVPSEMYPVFSHIILNVFRQIIVYAAFIFIDWGLALAKKIYFSFNIFWNHIDIHIII